MKQGNLVSLHYVDQSYEQVFEDSGVIQILLYHKEHMLYHSVKVAAKEKKAVVCYYKVDNLFPTFCKYGLT